MDVELPVSNGLKRRGDIKRRENCKNATANAIKIACLISTLFILTSFCCRYLTTTSKIFLYVEFYLPLPRLPDVLLVNVTPSQVLP
jgi:hypothetical protein